LTQGADSDYDCDTHPENMNRELYKPIRSTIGLTERHSCRRCNRTLPAQQFAPLPAAPGSIVGRVEMLHPYCNVCRGQVAGKWSRHPLYTNKVDRYFTKLHARVGASARVRGLPVQVCKDDLLGLYLEQGGRCALSGIELICETVKGSKNDVAPSPDRIDSRYGYIPGNVQIVAAVVNIMKNELSQDRFINLCRRILAHQSKRQEDLAEELVV
jgi:hypothetical protein